MNELSWLIYAADVAGTLKFAAGATIFVAGLTGVGAYLSRAYNGDMAKLYSRYDHSTDIMEQYEEKRSVASKTFRPTMIVAVIAASVFVLSPSSNTLYAIAASEMGERVISSETGGKAVDALNAWLDRQIAPTVAGEAE